MERSGGRSADERRAAREARERARGGRGGDGEEDLPLQQEERDGEDADEWRDEGEWEDEPDRQALEPSSSERGWRRPELRSMSRYGGGVDVYTRRRIVAGLVALAVIVALFLLLVGC